MRLDLSPFHFLRRFIELRKHLKRTVEKSQIKATDLIGPSLRCQKSEGRKLKHSVEISFSSFLSPSPSCYLFVSSYLSFLFEPLKHWSRFVCHSYLLFILFTQIYCWFKIILPYFLFYFLKDCNIDWDKIQDFTKVRGWFDTQTFYGKCFKLKFGFNKVGYKNGASYFSYFIFL